jgi:uncharacterized protein YdeI (YjbR/CyaY-like superfamily)
MAVPEYPVEYFATSADWRKWLKTNHDNSRGIWFTFFKKHTGKKSISYNEAVEEALCYGWIDSIIKRLDDEKYLQKFTPRTNSKKWSTSNIERMRALIKNKRITKYGLEKFPVELLNKKSLVKPAAGEMIIPDFIEGAIAKNKTALSNFEKLAPSYKKLFVRWVLDAKQEATRAKRVKEMIELLKQDKRLGLK